MPTIDASAFSIEGTIKVQEVQDGKPVIVENFGGVYAQKNRRVRGYKLLSQDVTIDPGNQEILIKDINVKDWMGVLVVFSSDNGFTLGSTYADLMNGNGAKIVSSIFFADTPQGISPSSGVDPDKPPKASASCFVIALFPGEKIDFKQEVSNSGETSITLTIDVYLVDVYNTNVGIENGMEIWRYPNPYGGGE